MKETHPFYSTSRWKQCRDGFIKYKGGLCEMCLSNGTYEPAVIAHHIIHLNEQNIYDESISLNWDNLMALCRKCHGEIHKGRRYSIDVNGNVMI